MALQSPAKVVWCPRGCPRRVVLRPVRLVRRGQRTKCGAACRKARTLHCDCECGGINHGKQGGYYVPSGGARHADSVPDWEGLVTDAEYVPAVVRPQMPGVVERLKASGAPPPYEYIGAGMTSVVFRSGALAYKVARGTSDSTRSLFLDEAEFLKTASRVARVRHRVAKFVRFDPVNLVITRRYVPRDPNARRGAVDLWDLHRELERLMLPHGWTAPEYKDDSYVLAKRGPVLVDAGFAHRVGKVLLRDVEEKLTGRRPWFHDTPQDLAFALRMEVGKTLTQEQIAPLEAKLKGLAAPMARS